MTTKIPEASKEVKQPIQNVREYFTPDINAAIGSMSIKEMLSILKELPGSMFWIAILKYNQERLGVTQSALFSGDPGKDPTGMARQQGIMLGISDLQNVVIQLNAPQEVDE